MTAPPSTSSSTMNPKSSLTANDLFPSSSYAPATASNVYRKVLTQAAAAICFINGFDSADANVLQLITHIMNSYMNSICASAKLNCEVAGRTMTIPTDVYLALINNGHDVSKLPAFLQSLSNGTLVIPPPKVQAPPPNPSPLRVGRSRHHPAHINDFLPPFPDPHTYIRTEISGEPDTSYENVRELAAQRKRETERSLVDFMLRVHARTCLFSEYEAKVKKEAARAMADRERQKEARRAARKHAKIASRIEATKKEVDAGIMPDQLIDDFLEDDTAQPPPREDSSSEEEDAFELEETETSLLLRRIPTSCYVLDPSLESRPYLSVLVSDEVQDDEEPETPIAAQQNTQNNGHQTDQQVYDNAFLRPPRMPSKIEFMEY